MLAQPGVLWWPLLALQSTLLEARLRVKSRAPDSCPGVKRVNERERALREAAAMALFGRSTKLGPDRQCGKREGGGFAVCRCGVGYENARKRVPGV